MMKPFGFRAPGLVAVALALSVLHAFGDPALRPKAKSKPKLEAVSPSRFTRSLKLWRDLQNRRSPTYTLKRVGDKKPVKAVNPFKSEKPVESGKAK